MPLWVYNEWHQASLSLNNGGFGLGFVEHITNAAYVASCSASIDHIKQYFPNRFQLDLNKATIVESGAEQHELLFPNMNCWMSRFLQTIDSYKFNCHDKIKNSTLTSSHSLRVNSHQIKHEFQYMYIFIGQNWRKNLFF